MTMTTTTTGCRIIAVARWNAAADDDHGVGGGPIVDAEIASNDCAGLPLGRHNIITTMTFPLAGSHGYGRDVYHVVYYLSVRA